MTRIAFVVVAAAVVAVAAQPRAEAGSTASRIVDRTLECTTGIQGGINVVDLLVQTGVKSRAKKGRWKEQAGFYLTTQGSSEPGPEQWVLAIGNAGRTEQGYGGTVSIGPGRCKAAPRIPLVSTGLKREPVTQFGDEYECWVAPRVIVRVRGVFGAPVTLRRNTFGYLTAMGGMASEVKLAVRTLKGKPLLYVETFESGKTSLYLSPGACHPE